MQFIFNENWILTASNCIKFGSNYYSKVGSTDQNLDDGSVDQKLYADHIEWKMNSKCIWLHLSWIKILLEILINRLKARQKDYQ